MEVIKPALEAEHWEVFLRFFARGGNRVVNTTLTITETQFCIALIEALPHVGVHKPGVTRLPHREPLEVLRKVVLHRVNSPMPPLGLEIPAVHDTQTIIDDSGYSVRVPIDWFLVCAIRRLSISPYINLGDHLPLADSPSFLELWRNTLGRLMSPERQAS